VSADPPRDERARPLLVPPRQRLATALACVTGLSDGAARMLADGPDRARAAGQAGWTIARLAGDAGVTVDDPAEAWEALCTTLDLPAWVDAPDRRFRGLGPCYCAALEADARARGDHPDNCASCRGIERARACPWSAADAVALASDPVGVATAELLAREAAARFQRFGAPQPARVAWRVAPRATWVPLRPNARDGDRLLGTCWHAASRATIGRAAAIEVATARMLIDGVSEATTACYRRDHYEAACWDAAARLGEHVYGPGGFLTDDPVADVPSPWAPLVDIWGLGYGLDAMTDTDLVLVCPALPTGAA
jgi:hypothetical protein